MLNYPEKIENEEQLEELLSRPEKEAVEMFKRLEGDVIFLGVAGKIGKSLALMAKRACNEAGVKKKIIGVSMFENNEQRQKLENSGIETSQKVKANAESPAAKSSKLNKCIECGIKTYQKDGMCVLCKTGITQIYELIESLKITKEQEGK